MKMPATKMHKTLFLLFFVFLSQIQANAQEKTLVIEDSLLHYPYLFSHTYLFRDTVGLNFDQIKTADFQLFTEKKIYEIKKNPEVLWLKMNIDNRFSHQHYRFFVPKHDSVFVYLLNLQNHQIITKNISGLLKYAQKEYKENFWNTCQSVLFLEKGQQYQLFIRLKDAKKNQNLLWIDADQVWLKTEFEKTNVLFQISRIFNGMLLIMFLYNFMLYLTSKERIYLYYSFYTFFANCTLFFPYSRQFLKDWAEYSVNFLGLSFVLQTIFYLLFSKEFVEIKKNYPRWDRITKYYFGLSLLVNLGVTVFFVENNNAVYLSAMASIIFCFVFFLSVSSFKNTMSKIFFIGNITLYSFSFLALLSSFESIHQLFKIGFSGYYLAQIGVILEILIFSVGLGYRIRINEKEKRKAQQELNIALKDQNEILEKKIKEKTKELLKYTEELQTSYNEIKTVNEELYQTQEEMMSHRDSLEIKNLELESQKFKISQSIESAKLIQNAILPTRQKLDSIFAENFVILFPKDIVSGDFYMVNQVENKKFLIVADCTGHGISGAFMTMIGNTLIDRIINVSDIHDPKTILDKLHSEIQNVLQQKQTNNTDGMDIAITVLEELDNQVNIVFSAAKRPLYYLPKGEKQVQKIAGSRKMIGGYEMQNKEFVNEYLTLPKGSFLYLCTDGYADQNNVERHKFGEKAMLHLLSETPFEEQEQKLSTEILEYMKGEEQRDDILLLGIKV